MSVSFNDKVTKSVICALDTGDLELALKTVRRLGDKVGAFKIGHALTLPNGLSIIHRLQDAGAGRIFLDLKFHDIPNSVAIAVREAAKAGVWMMTLHTSGGRAMLEAATEEAHEWGLNGIQLVGVSVLTSLTQRDLIEDIGIARSLSDQMVSLSKMALECGLDGVVCSPQEVVAIRAHISRGVIVCPGIRLPSGDTHDQARTGSATEALKAGADYLVIGRALSESSDPEKVLEEFGLLAGQS